MAREKALYRDNLERLDNLFPNKELLTLSDVCTLCKIAEEKAKRLFPFMKDKNRYYISKPVLASKLS